MGRQITRLLLTRPDHLQPDEQAQLADIRAQCPHLDSLARHVTAFAEMMANLTGGATLDTWLAAADSHGSCCARSFTYRYPGSASAAEPPCEPGRYDQVLG